MGMIGRQFILLSLGATLAGCGDFGIEPSYEAPTGRGAIVADEPMAALVARNVLSAGGGAADAAVALYFTLAVTYPASAGLGGQGVCVVRQPPVTSREKPRAETIDFTSPPNSRPASAGMVPVGVPANARGMFALHARYGRLLWSQLVQPAENLARFGTTVSRALAEELRKGASVLGPDPSPRSAFFDRDGAPLREGQRLVQLDLAGILGRIRAHGPGGLYTGDLARSLVDGVRQAGGDLDVADLRAFRPHWRKAIVGEAGTYATYFAPREVEGGAIAARLWKLLYEDGRYGDAATEAREAVIVKAVAEVMARRDGIRSPGPGALADPAVSGFAVMDGAGGAVACAVTMNGRFGTGRMIRGTGIVAAAAPGGVNDGRAVLSPVLVASAHSDTAIAAFAPSGNAAATTALITVALGILREDRGLPVALAAMRAHPDSGGSDVYVERANGLAERIRGGTGLRPVRVEALGRVNVIFCPDGLPRRPDSCVFRADPRGHGYAVDALP